MVEQAGLVALEAVEGARQLVGASAEVQRLAPGAGALARAEGALAGAGASVAEAVQLEGCCSGLHVPREAR